MKDITAIPDVPLHPHPVETARKGRGFSREDLASKARVSVKTIERIERREGVTPHRTTRESIARVLRCKSDELFELEAAA